MALLRSPSMILLKKMEVETIARGIYKNYQVFNRTGGVAARVGSRLNLRALCLLAMRSGYKVMP